MPRRKLRVSHRSPRATDSPPPDGAPKRAEELLGWLLEFRQLLMPGEVAGILRIDKKKVYVLPIPRIELSERRVRYDPHSVRSYLISKTTGMLDPTPLASFCTSFGMHGGMMNAHDVGRFLRVPTRHVGTLDIPSQSSREPGRTWPAAQVAAWLWAHRREPARD